MKSYSAVVKQGRNYGDAVQLIADCGAKEISELRDSVIVLFRADDTTRNLVERLPCIQSVEENRPLRTTS